jgi:hypothetical protein
MLKIPDTAQKIVVHGRAQQDRTKGADVRGISSLFVIVHVTYALENR